MWRGTALEGETLVGRDLRREHELRSAALRRRARRARRGARSAVRRHDPRAAGQLPRVLRRWSARAVVTEFNYRISDATRRTSSSASQLGRPGEAQALAALVRERAASPTLDLTDDELAKLHVRHMVGGRSALAQDEQLYRFEFPERPGALMRFLDSMAPDWNISLFHYRNHGADLGRVLVGLQVPPRDRPALRRFLADLGYRHWDETDNPAYQLFLR